MTMKVNHGTPKCARCKGDPTVECTCPTIYLTTCPCGVHHEHLKEQVFKCWNCSRLYKEHSVMGVSNEIS
ncbi:hypothetical protein LCGC14_0424980 [marine sediment metagenome]|uniref:Uncharacterized protein n=1 Tax=marine sediment metagenome TaxID=412755 RepID=A0A0F9VBY9_9ZZZZ